MSSVVLCWVQGSLVVSVWVYNDLFSGRIHKVRIWCRLYQCRNYQLVHPLWPSDRRWLIPCKIIGTTTFLLEQVELWRSGAFGVRVDSALEYRTCSSSRWAVGCSCRWEEGEPQPGKQSREPGTVLSVKTERQDPYLRGIGQKRNEIWKWSSKIFFEGILGR